MSYTTNSKSPAAEVAGVWRADYDLSNHGINGLQTAFWNLTTETLYEEAVFRGEGSTTIGGPFVAHTGKHTGRSPNDKFVVKHVDSENNVWWGSYNRPFEGLKFDALFDRMKEYLKGREVFIQDVYAGADPKYRLNVRIITEQAWHSMFIRNMFILPQTSDEIKKFIPGFTIVDIPSLRKDKHIADKHTMPCLLSDYADI